MREIICNYKTLRESLGSLIEKSGYKVSYIAEKVGMTPNNFYVKKQRASWNEDEMEAVLDVIENEDLEDYFLGQIMKDLKADETVTFAELKKQMAWK